MPITTRNLWVRLEVSADFMALSEEQMTVLLQHGVAEIPGAKLETVCKPPENHDDLIERARANFAESSDDHIEVDDDAPISEDLDGEGAWVGAWLWMQNEEEDRPDEEELQKRSAALMTGDEDDDDSEPRPDYSKVRE